MLRFGHRLALALGEGNVDELLERLTARQLRQWQAFWRLEPFGDLNRLIAQLVAMTAAREGVTNKRTGQPFVADDFLPVEPWDD